MSQHRHKARRRLASTLADAARILPRSERIEFRAFLSRLTNGEDTTDPVPKTPRGKSRPRTRAARRMKQVTLPGFE